MDKIVFEASSEAPSKRSRSAAAQGACLWPAAGLLVSIAGHGARHLALRSYHAPSRSDAHGDNGERDTLPGKCHGLAGGVTAAEHRAAAETLQSTAEALQSRCAKASAGAIARPAGGPC